MFLNLRRQKSGTGPFKDTKCNKEIFFSNGANILTMPLFWLVTAACLYSFHLDLSFWKLPCQPSRYALFSTMGKKKTVQSVMEVCKDEAQIHSDLQIFKSCVFYDESELSAPSLSRACSSCCRFLALILPPGVSLVSSPRSLCLLSTALASDSAAAPL